MKTAKKTKFIVAISGILAFCLVGFAAFSAYISDYYRADEKAVSIQNKANVIKTEEGYFLSSDANIDTALIFYPGAKVEFNAYLPLLDGLCEQGLSCYLVEMPFHLAFFGINIADEIIKKNPQIEHWYIAGHSLGGAIASSYASSHATQIDGLILYAAYPNGDYPLGNTLTIYGSLNTSVEEKIDYTDNVVKIEGGNHAQFGNYGKQDGDVDATISQEEQQRIAIEETIRFIFE